MKTLGKIIGIGLPVGAFSGRKEIIEKLITSGGIFQTGTLSGNPLAITAWVETLKFPKKGGIYLAPSKFESTFVSVVHSDENIEKTIEAETKVFKISGKYKKGKGLGCKRKSTIMAFVFSRFILIDILHRYEFNILFLDRGRPRV